MAFERHHEPETAAFEREREISTFNDTEICRYFLSLSLLLFLISISVFPGMSNYITVSGVKKRGVYQLARESGKAREGDQITTTLTAECRNQMCDRRRVINQPNAGAFIIYLIIFTHAISICITAFIAR